MKVFLRYGLLLLLLVPIESNARRARRPVKKRAPQRNVPKSTTSGITYKLNGGRFGDNLFTYIKAKWLSHKYDIPLYYKTFKYVNQLVMHEKETGYYSDTSRAFNKSQAIKHDGPNVIKPDAIVLYVSDYYFKSPEWQKWDDIGTWDDVWADYEFIEKLRAMIYPCKEMQLVELPENVRTVALHVRKGGGFDPPLLAEGAPKRSRGRRRHKFADKAWPLKFPPDQYYVEQLIVLSELFDDAPLHVHLFTDDKNPEALVNKYRAAVGKENITYACRIAGNSHTSNVLQDFFSLMCCDCLIRSDSSFSKVAHLLGNFEVVLYPVHGKWQGNTLVIDQVNVMDNR